MGFRNAPIPAPHPTPYNEDEMLAQLKQALIDNQDNLYLSKKDTTPVSIPGARSAAIPEEIPAVDDYGNSISQATVQQAEEANLEKLRRALAGQFDNQQKILEGDVGAQRAYLDSVRGQPVTVNENATLAGLFRTAGVSPQNYAAQLAAATPETPQERQDRLRKALGDVVGGQDKLADNLRSQLDMQLKMMDRGKEARQERNLEAQAMRDARKEALSLQKDGAELSQTYTVASEALDDYGTGEVTVGSVKRALSQIARIMGEKGVLTDLDLARQLERTLGQDIESLKTYLSRNPEKSKISVKEVATLRDSLALAMEKAKAMHDLKTSSFNEYYKTLPATQRQFLQGGAGEVLTKNLGSFSLQTPGWAKKVNEERAAKKAPKVNITEQDIDNMSIEQLKAAGLI